MLVHFILFTYILEWHEVPWSIIFICFHWSCWQKGGGNVRSKFFEQGLNKISLEEKGNGKEPVICLKPPPPPLAPLSPSVSSSSSPALSPSSLSLEEHSEDKSSVSLETQPKELPTQDNVSSQDIPDDDFGDFQVANWKPGVFVRLELRLFCCGRMDGMVCTKVSFCLFILSLAAVWLYICLTWITYACQLSLAHAHGVSFYVG